MKNRSDAAVELLDYYEGLSVVNTKSGEIELSEIVKPLHLGYVELVLASDVIPQLYDDVNYKRLEKISQSILQLKIQRSEDFSIQTISKSLLLAAKVKLQKHQINPNDSEFLRNFIETGGMASDPDIYTKVSKIVK